MVSESLISRKVLITVEDGTTTSGSTKVASRTISNINSSATAAQMYATANAISTLMDNTLANIYYDDKKLLEDLSADDDDEDEDDDENAGDGENNGGAGE